MWISMEWVIMGEYYIDLCNGYLWKSLMWTSVEWVYVCVGEM
jgi:hypothetical protein